MNNYKHRAVTQNLTGADYPTKYKLDVAYKKIRTEIINIIETYSAKSREIVIEAIRHTIKSTKTPDNSSNSPLMEDKLFGDIYNTLCQIKIDNGNRQSAMELICNDKTTLTKLENVVNALLVGDTKAVSRDFDIQYVYNFFVIHGIKPLLDKHGISEQEVEFLHNPESSRSESTSKYSSNVFLPRANEEGNSGQSESGAGITYTRKDVEKKIRNVLKDSDFIANKQKTINTIMMVMDFLKYDAVDATASWFCPPDYNVAKGSEIDTDFLEALKGDTDVIQSIRRLCKHTGAIGSTLRSAIYDTSSIKELKGLINAWDSTDSSILDAMGYNNSIKFLLGIKEGAETVAPIIHKDKQNSRSFQETNSRESLEYVTDSEIPVEIGSNPGDNHNRKKTNDGESKDHGSSKKQELQKNKTRNPMDTHVRQFDSSSKQVRSGSPTVVQSMMGVLQIPPFQNLADDTDSETTEEIGLNPSNDHNRKKTNAGESKDRGSSKKQDLDQKNKTRNPVDTHVGQFGSSPKHVRFQGDPTVVPGMMGVQPRQTFQKTHHQEQPDSSGEDSTTTKPELTGTQKIQLTPNKSNLNNQEAKVISTEEESGEGEKINGKGRKILGLNNPVPPTESVRQLKQPQIRKEVSPHGINQNRDFTQIREDVANCRKNISQLKENIGRTEHDTLGKQTLGDMVKKQAIKTGLTILDQKAEMLKNIIETLSDTDQTAPDWVDKLAEEISLPVRQMIEPQKPPVEQYGSPYGAAMIIGALDTRPIDEIDKEQQTSDFGYDDGGLLYPAFSQKDIDEVLGQIKNANANVNKTFNKLPELIQALEIPKEEQTVLFETHEVIMSFEGKVNETIVALTNEQGVVLEEVNNLFAGHDKLLNQQNQTTREIQDATNRLTELEIEYMAQREAIESKEIERKLAQAFQSSHLDQEKRISEVVKNIKNQLNGILAKQTEEHAKTNEINKNRIAQELEENQLELTEWLQHKEKKLKKAAKNGENELNKAIKEFNAQRKDLLSGNTKKKLKRMNADARKSLEKLEEELRKEKEARKELQHKVGSLQEQINSLKNSFNLISKTPPQQKAETSESTSTSLTRSSSASPSSSTSPGSVNTTLPFGADEDLGVENKNITIEKLSEKLNDCEQKLELVNKSGFSDENQGLLKTLAKELKELGKLPKYLPQQQINELFQQSVRLLAVLENLDENSADYSELFNTATQMSEQFKQMLSSAKLASEKKRKTEEVQKDGFKTSFSTIPQLFTSPTSPVNIPPSPTNHQNIPPLGRTTSYKKIENGSKTTPTHEPAVIRTTGIDLERLEENHSKKNQGNSFETNFGVTLKKTEGKAQILSRTASTPRAPVNQTPTFVRVEPNTPRTGTSFQKKTPTVGEQSTPNTTHSNVNSGDKTYEVKK